MNYIGLDFETFYDPDDGYTLRKMTIEEYLRDPRFEVIMMATHDPLANDGAGASRYEHIPKDLTDWIKTGIDWDNTVIVSWNAHFDAAILAWHYGVRPRGVICAMAMWRYLGFGIFGGESLAVAANKGVEWGWPGVTPKGHEVDDAKGKNWIDFTCDQIKSYGRYCMADAANAYYLYKGMMLRRRFPPEEVVNISEQIRCFTEPRLVLDTAVLQEVYDKRIARQEEAMRKIGIADKSQLRSDEMFAKSLRAAGVEDIPMKLNAKGQKRYAFAKTDRGMQDILEGDNELASDLVEARLMVKSSITETRAQRLISISKRGRFPVPLRPGGAHTLRASGFDSVNAQNFSKRDGTRDAITVPDGFVLLDPDSSQIEARYVGYNCDQHDLTEDFRRRADVYCKFGNNSGVFQVEVTKATPNERFLCKTIVLGGGYGAAALTMQRSARNLAFSLDLGADVMAAIDAADWEALKEAYRTQNYAIKATWYQLTKMLQQLMETEPCDGEIVWGPLIRMGVDDIGPGLILPNDLRIYYHNLRWDEEDNNAYYDKVRGRQTVKTKLYGAKVLENFTQAVAGLTIREQWNKIVRRGRKEFGLKYGSIVLQVHDALTAMVRKGVAKEYGLMMLEVMRTPPVWAPGVPLDAELKMGTRYGQLEEVKA